MQSGEHADSDAGQGSATEIPVSYYSLEISLLTSWFHPAFAEFPESWHDGVQLEPDTLNLG